MCRFWFPRFYCRTNEEDPLCDSQVSRILCSCFLFFYQFDYYDLFQCRHHHYCCPDHLSHSSLYWTYLGSFGCCRIHSIYHNYNYNYRWIFLTICNSLALVHHGKSYGTKKDFFQLVVNLKKLSTQNVVFLFSMSILDNLTSIKQ